MDGSIDLAGQSTAGVRNATIPQQNAEIPRSPARAELAIAILDLACAAAELAAAQEPATRLGGVIAEATRLGAEVAALRAGDEAQLGAWLAGSGDDLRPEPGPATIAAEKRLAALAADAIAARASLPGAERSFQHCAERVREAQRRRDRALCGAAIEAACDFAQLYRASLTIALEHEAVLHGLREELLARGNRPDAGPGPMEAAARIGALISQTKRDAAVRRHPEPGQRLLATLTSDFDAVL
jgi:hypothetical protein